MNEKAIVDTLNALKLESNEIKSRILSLEKIVRGIIEALSPKEQITTVGKLEVVDERPAVDDKAKD